MKKKPKTVEIQDIAFFVGIILLVAGVAWIYKPAALIALGLILIAIAWTMSGGAPPAEG